MVKDLILLIGLGLALEERFQRSYFTYWFGACVGRVISDLFLFLVSPIKRK